MLSTYRKSIFTIICVLLFLLSLAHTGKSQNSLKSQEPTQSISTDRQQILFLNTFQIGLPIPDSIDKGVLTALKEGGGSINDIFMEHLDFTRNSSKSFRAKTADLLRKKIAGKNIGIIIAEGTPVLDFLKMEAKGLVPDAALLTLITPINDLSLNGFNGVIDIPWQVDPAGTLSVALDLFPKTRRVVIVTGARDGVLPFLDRAKKAFNQWNSSLDFEYTNEMTYEQMLQRISSLPPDTIVIYSPFFSDTTGRSFAPVEVAIKVSQSANAPVFANLEAYLGLGIVGGSLLKTESIGQQAGKIALDYLHGRLKLEKPLTTFNTGTQKMFDWNELLRWKADTSALPTDSIIINRPHTLFEQHKKEVLAAGAAFLAMSILILMLLTLNRRLKRLTVTASNSEARFRVMTEQAPDAILVYDIDSKRFVEVNPSAERLFGCCRDELLKTGPKDFYPSAQPDHRPISDSFAEYNQRVLAGEDLHFERAVHSADGRDLLCEVHLSRLPDDHRRLLRSSFIDITERKQAVEKVRASKAYLDKIINNIGDPVFVKDDQHRFTLVNDAFCSILGLPRGEIIGKTLSEDLPPDEMEHFVKIDRQVLTDGQESLCEELLTVKGEKTLTIVTKKTRYVDKNGDKFLIGVIRDITEQKKAEEKYEKLTAQLQQSQKMEAIGTLAGGIAHDFNNILGAIIGYTEMARDDSPNESSVAKDLDKVLEASDRAAGLVKQILSFSRQDETECILLQPASIINKTLALLRPTLPTTIEISQDIDTANGLIFADPTQIHQILMNLCTNAFHAMEETGGILSISLKEINLCRENIPHEPHIDTGTFVQLSVRDSGTGMTKEVEDKIFEPYFTTKGVGKGTGMGLSIVHGIIKSYGGFITLSNELGKGAVFHIFLPVINKKDLPDNKAIKQIPVGIEKILFIDDEDVIADMGKNMLERLGYHVTVRKSSLEALETFKNQPDLFDVVITDQTMPGMTGVDLARRMLQIRPDIPIILCTGYSSTTSEKKAKSFGIKEFALKPLGKKDIARLIRKVLDDNQTGGQ